MRRRRRAWADVARPAGDHSAARGGSPRVRSRRRGSSSTASRSARCRSRAAGRRARLLPLERRPHDLLLDVWARRARVAGRFPLPPVAPGRGAGAAAGQPDTGAGLFAIGIDGRDRRTIASGNFAGMVPTPDRRFVFFRAAPEKHVPAAEARRRRTPITRDRSASADHAGRAQRSRRVRVPDPRRARGRVEADVRGDVAGDEVPLLQPGDERQRLDGRQGQDTSRCSPTPARTRTSTTSATR